MGLLLALQANEFPLDEPAQHPPRFSAGLGPDLEWWDARFSAQVKVDGNLRSGTSIDLVQDLKMSDERGIPIYGGGTIYVALSRDEQQINELLLTGEYWSRSWTASTKLGSDEVLDDTVFTNGTAVESHFRLSSLDLAITLRATNTFTWVRAGGSLLLHGTDGQLRIKSATQIQEVSVGDLTWGLGGFFEYRPWNILTAGVSAKGYINFGDSNDAWTADLRAYAGVEWKFFRFETGIRYTPYSELHPDKDSFRYDLYGAYVSLSLWLSF